MARISYEGTFEEIASLHGAALANKQVTLTVETDDKIGNMISQAFPPNEAGLAIMRKMAEGQKGQRVTTDGSDTKALIREARGGAMYGYDPID